jgi:D-amino-acid dehydrogenase
VPTHKLNPTLIRILKEKGVKFMLDTEIKEIQTQGDSVTGLLTSTGEILKADQYMICTNNKDAFFQFRWVPTLTIAGMSFTVPLTPERTKIWETHSKKDSKVITLSDDNTWYVNFGDFMRISTGYWVNFNPELVKRDWEVIKDKLFFPLNFEDGKICTRHCTADNLPLIGRHENLKNLVMNSGYGNIGWTLGSFGGWYVRKVMDGSVGEVNPLSPYRFTAKGYLRSLTYKESPSFVKDQCI